MSHASHKSIAIGFVVDGVFVAIAIVIVDEPSHADEEVIAGDRIIFGTVGKFVECVKVHTTVEIPDGRGRSTALARSKDGAIVAVLVEPVRDSHFGLNAVYGVL
jgi:hypothetical protein